MKIQTPVLALTTDKTKVARFASADAAVAFGTSKVVPVGGVSKIVKVDGSFGDVTNKPEVAIEINAVSGTFDGKKYVVNLDVPHYAMDTAAFVDQHVVAVDDLKAAA